MELPSYIKKHINDHDGDDHQHHHDHGEHDDHEADEPDEHDEHRYLMRVINTMIVMDTWCFTRESYGGCPVGSG